MTIPTSRQSSGDNGLSWIAVNAGLGNLDIGSLVFNGTDLYAGTRSGVFKSANNGTNWTGFNEGFVDVPNATSLYIQGNYMYANNGQNQCYNASGTIVVAGGENTFLVQNGGQATFIAGQMISFLPGTKVEEGGYLLGTITTTGQYCGVLPAAKSVAMATEGLSPVTEIMQFRLWPNPTTGSFTLEQSGDGTGQDLKLEIYSMLGERILADNIIGEKQHQFMLGNVPTGIYLVRILAGEKGAWPPFFLFILLSVVLNAPGNTASNFFLCYR
jgi:hypothetical protein